MWLKKMAQLALLSSLSTEHDSGTILPMIQMLILPPDYSALKNHGNLYINTDEHGRSAHLFHTGKYN